jgi:NDP-sugar pyrophosphorylase family protein
MKAMVLAAGVGSRLDPLTNQLPKPLVPVANRPVMEHILNLLQKHGFNSIISNLHYLPDKIKEYFGDGANFGTSIEYYFEEALSGDAGGVRACREFLQGDTFIVVMGDLLTDANLTNILQEHKEKKALATIAIKQVEDVSQFGVVLTDKNGFITGFQEKPKPNEALSNYASTGIYILEPEIFDYIPKQGDYFFGRQLFPSLLSLGKKVLASEITGYWSDVGTISQYKLSNFDVLAGHMIVKARGQSTKWGYLGDNAKVSDKAIINGKLMIGINSQIADNVKITGNVIIGDNCLVGENTELVNTIIWDNSKIGKNVSLIDCVVGANCTVESDTRYQAVAAVSWPPPVCSSSANT